MKAIEDELDRRREAGRAVRLAQLVDRGAQAVDVVDPIGVLGRGKHVADLDFPAILERGDHTLQVLDVE